jgi:maltose alpha-D-glucosyltransferase/alpha-amylase
MFMENFSNLLQKLYRDKADTILSEIEAYKKILKLEEKPLPNTTWYRYINLYFIYPDAIPGRKGNSLSRLLPYLSQIKEQGCDAVHILPFLASPMKDRGFDVSDYLSVRKDLGTMNDVKAIMKESETVGLKVFMDLILNHVSEEHSWFKKAMSGDEKYRNYFIHQKTKPQYVRKFHKDSAVWAEYIVNGEKTVINIAFPEYAGEIPHWRQGNDGYWYYHTYYPSQLDVNWHNPDIFIEYAKIIMYWGALGFNFRLDAIPFVGKSAYKQVDNNSEFTRNLLASFTQLTEAINPEAVFIVETYEKSNTVIDYFGDPNRKQARLGYNFHLCTNLWVSLVKKDTTYLWNILGKLKDIPAHADWINFLRNHDELSLAYLDDETLKYIKRKLLRFGKPFREGYGISGRTYSLLGNNEKRFISAYLLLSSLPGGILLPYGDEFGKVNLSLDELSDSEKEDTRNINRGVISQKEMHSPKGKRISEKLKDIFTNRKHLQEYLNIWPTMIKTQKEVFGAVYKSGSSQLVIFINLSHRKQVISFTPDGFVTIQKLWEVKTTTDEIILAPYAGVWLQK